ncbi:RNA polymerase sigma factor [Bacillus sp. SG-1]|uniref:RNA polymerase sigma factor n=1 Tax=Bacillus sp. SG-1 TaxID=161544 RepID=UPI0002F7E7DE|nr:RNA polymerase sigma factor [Bacillus sp. SG-1]
MKDSSLNEVYETHFQDVYHYLLYFTNSQSDAEDLTQDTFIRALKNYEQFEQRSSVKTWILSIARRTAIDHYRKRKVISILPDIIAHLGKSNEGNPDIELDQTNDWETLQKALATLKPDYRNVVILRGLKEYSVKETAEILNCKESKVKVDFHRAIKLLKNQLSKSSEGVVIFNEQKRS